VEVSSVASRVCEDINMSMKMKELQKVGDIPCSTVGFGLPDSQFDTLPD
jgi:hypothetical protein